MTIAEVKNKKVDVITSRGDKYLGGKDFDYEITKLMSQKYNEKLNSDLDLENNKEYMKKAEEIKKILSVKDKASVTVNGPKGETSFEISKVEFEESIQTYIEKTKCL